jgi:type III secretory pathway component EscS
VELKGGKCSFLQKVPFSSLWLKTVWYVPVVVFALLFGMLVSIWRKNDCTLLCTQLM